MTELAELRQRVQSVGARFRGTAEEDRKRSERLSSLLSAVEGGFARSQHEIKRLNEELAHANEEKQQIQALLQTPLAEGEDTGAREEGESPGAEDREDKELLAIYGLVAETPHRRWRHFLGLAD